MRYGAVRYDAVRCGAVRDVGSSFIAVGFGSVRFFASYMSVERFCSLPVTVRLRANRQK